MKISSISKKLKNKYLISSNKTIHILIALSLILRISYVGFTHHQSGDYERYQFLAEGVLNCIQGNDLMPKCEVFRYGYMPVYITFLAICKYLTGSIDYSVYVVAALQGISMITIFLVLYKLLLNKDVSVLALIVLLFSPLGIGFSRLILIEPFLLIFSNFQLALLLLLFSNNSNRRKENRILLLLTANTIIGIMTKQTFVLTIIGSAIAVFINCRKSIIIKYVFLILSSFLACQIILTGILSTSLVNSPMNTQNPWIPKNSHGYVEWLKTWATTEYEGARFGFPIHKTPFRLDFNEIKSPFLSIDQKERISRYYKEKMGLNNKGFTKEDSAYFVAEAKANKKELGIILYSLPVLRGMNMHIHPYNSWGFPLEISNTNGELIDLTARILGKILLFCYRFLLLVGIFAVSISAIKSMPSKFHFLRNNNKITPSTSISLLPSVYIFFAGICILFGMKEIALEHRYILIYTTWIEVALLLSLDHKKSIKSEVAKATPSSP